MKEEEVEFGVYEMCDMLLFINEVLVKKYCVELVIMMFCKWFIKVNYMLDDYLVCYLLD